MRARQHPEVIAELDNRTYSQWLLDLGNGTIPYTTLSAKAIIGGSRAPQDLIQIPRTFQLDNINQLIEFVFDNDYVNKNNGNKAILCPTNAAVAHVNNIILDKLVNIEERTYYSIDEYNQEEDDDEFHVTMDLLNSIEAASLPPHELKLKIGAIVMILRNVDVEDGICNGSRVRVIGLGEHIIECELLSADGEQQRPLETTDNTRRILLGDDDLEEDEEHRIFVEDDNDSAEESSDNDSACDVINELQNFEINDMLANIDIDQYQNIDNTTANRSSDLFIREDEIMESTCWEKIIQHVLAEDHIVGTNDNERRVGETEEVMVDEIRQYQDFRFVSSMEATWRILEYKMHDRSHSVLVLPVHLQGELTLLYEEFDDFDNIQRRLDSRSKLEAFFKLNREDQEARRYSYAEIPEHYTWDNKNAEWKRSRQISKQLGCIV
ncbi:unnamed protein product [Psylliodes chrysocephalus]|uniref:DNA helicase Pif1-like 2B domain-containing protein n=1 Tax=Psylliodes chrysocephalus TaxID=3402493 RepID=A0A9P0DCG2_9CUCU|nr:unnamed protein product [Psylliodes chrysocephala]